MFWLDRYSRAERRGVFLLEDVAALLSNLAVRFLGGFWTEGVEGGFNWDFKLLGGEFLWGFGQWIEREEFFCWWVNEFAVVARAFSWVPFKYFFSEVESMGGFLRMG